MYTHVELCEGWPDGRRRRCEWRRESHKVIRDVHVNFWFTHRKYTVTSQWPSAKCCTIARRSRWLNTAQLHVDDDDDDYNSAGNDVHVLFCSSIRITTCTSHRPRYSMYPNCRSDDLVNIRENHISWIADNSLPLCSLTQIIRLYIVSPQPLHDLLVSGSAYTNCFTYITFISLKNHKINNRISM